MDHLRTFYVYEHWRTDTNQCFYVGKGFKRRAWDFKRNRNLHHKNIVSKVLRNGFRVDVIIVEQFTSEEEAFFLEMKLIQNYADNGVGLSNQTKGGDGMSGWKPSQKTLDKWSEIFTGEGNPMYGKLGSNHPSFGYRHTQEHREKMSKKFSGSLNPMFGKEPYNKGKPSPLKGTTHSEETKRKRSESLKGERNPMFNKAHSEETRKKMSESHRRRLGVLAVR